LRIGGFAMIGIPPLGRRADAFAPSAVAPSTVVATAPGRRRRRVAPWPPFEP
jgi:hypothetical protein